MVVANAIKIKIQVFQKLIIKWFENNGRHFNWRKDGLSDYEIIISEILLQRTKAETISKFYDHFLFAYPDWTSLAAGNLTDLEQCLTPIGLYRQRAMKLKNLAVYMMSTDLPADRSELDKIPFMGQYIANAVELLIFKKNKPLLDVNMARVLERYFGQRKLVDIRYDPYLQSLAQKVVNHEKSKELNWAILDFASAICKNKKPECLNCILSSDCVYYNNLKKIS